MGYKRFSYDAFRTFCLDAFTGFGFSEDEAKIIADVLLMSDLYGIESHGMQRVVLYHKCIKNGMIKIDAKPKTVFETPISAVIDADDSMGQLVSHKAMSMAIEKAKNVGVGIVTVRGSNHYGMAGYYAKMACNEGLMGFSFTNSEGIMVPTFGRFAMIGSNPIACAFPADPYDFFFDAATTVVTRGKVELYNKRGDTLPEGWCLDEKGNVGRDASAILKNLTEKRGGGIVPLGGNTELLGGHKGYGYGMICEIFTSILSLGATSNYGMLNGKSGTCHGFMAINPAFFGDPAEIKAHLSKFLQEIRESPTAEGHDRIYTHGEKEMEAVADRMANGILANENTMAELFDVCEYLNLDFSKYFGDYHPVRTI